jgi:hypothetical protein
MEPITRKDKLRVAIFVVVLALFPYPLGMLLALGIPLGWVYPVVYAGWVAFAVFLGWLGLGRWSKRVSRWPHLRLMYALMGAFFLWYALTHTVLEVSPALNWFVFIMLAVWFLLEGMIVAPEERAKRARLRDAKTR